MAKMERRVFGATGTEVPVVGQGTWKIEDRGSAQDALLRGIELGMTHIDTAEAYTGSEETIRPVLEGRREDVFLVSKVQPDHATFNGTKEACQASLERLGADHLDVYLLHWPSQHPLEDTMAAMGELIDEGRIKAAGVSNFDVEGMELALEALGRHELACNQVLYHMEERGIEAEVVPFCRDKGIAVVGYSPFGSGDFVDPGSRGGEELVRIARKHTRTPRQVALRFLTREAPLFTIPKAEQVSHVEENAGAVGWSLDPEDIEALDAAFPVPEQVEGVPTA